MTQRNESLSIIYKKVECLIPYINNPRIITEDAINAVASSIKNFGFKSPIIIDQQNEIIAGHTRLLAAKKLGMKEVPCLITDDLTTAQRRAYRIADNKTGEYAQWDDEILSIELEMLQEDFEELDLMAEMTGFSEEEISSLLDAFNEQTDDDYYDDEEIELPEESETISESGDLWQLGKHRVLCGDATNLKDAEKLMSGQLAKMGFTDPPYNVAYVGKTEDALTIQNDEMKSEQFKEFLTACFRNILVYAELGAPIYVCHADSERINFQTAFEEAGWVQKQTIIWEKDSFVLGRQDYHWRHEPIIYGWKPGAAHKWYGGRNQDTVWEIERPKRNAVHPTMKPIPLIIKAVKNSSMVGDIVVDFFGGSGSTLIGCAEVDRISYLMELDPRYCDVIVRRYIQYCIDQSKPIHIKLNGEEFDYTVFEIEE